MKRKIRSTDTLGFGHLGNGIIVWDSSREKHGDYLRVAHISSKRVVTFDKVSLSDEQKRAILHFATTADPSVSESQEAKVFETRPGFDKP